MPHLHTALCFLLVAASACTADSFSERDRNEDPLEDELQSDTLGAPFLDAIPELTPHSTVAIRGTTKGSRMVVQTPSSTEVTSVLPGGSFCFDAPLQLTGPTELTIYAVGGDGRVSVETTVVVTRDAAAAPPSNATCSGVIGETTCAATEMCGGAEGDADCDGYTDMCDSDCNGCQDDIFEPNDEAVDVPTLAAGTYQLSLCPCKSDWFAFNVAKGQRVHAKAAFVDAEINVNMRLYRAGYTANLSDTIVGSYTSTDEESIDWIADEAGTYFLNVYVYTLSDPTVQNGDYTFTIY